eukprot:g16795.t1
MVFTPACAHAHTYFKMDFRPFFRTFGRRSSPSISLARNCSHETALACPGEFLTITFATAVLAATFAPVLGFGRRSTLRHLEKELDTFSISTFKDITAFIYDGVKRELEKDGKLTVTIKYVRNADEAHADLKNSSFNMVGMSYDDTISMAVQEGYDSILAAMPLFYSGMNLAGEINVAEGKTRVGIDTNTGYARMLRQYLKSTLSPEEYSQIQWIFAGATNLRAEALVKGELDATLLNMPYTSMLPSGTPLLPFYKFTGPIQGSCINVEETSLHDEKKKKALSTFIDYFQKYVLYMKANSDSTKADLVALLQPTDFCFNSTRLGNVESIFAIDTGIPVPSDRAWVMDFGCKKKRDKSKKKGSKSKKKGSKSKKKGQGIGNQKNTQNKKHNSKYPECVSQRVDSRFRIPLWLELFGDIQRSRPPQAV